MKNTNNIQKKKYTHLHITRHNSLTKWKIFNNLLFSFFI